MNDFHECLEYSHSGRHLSLWKEVYEKGFPGCVMVDHREDGEHQRAGIDRSLIMPNSKQILVDEKLRRRNKNGTIYKDIALEYLSDEARKTPGWVCKALRADFIAYAIAPLGKCYLLPVMQLQAAWLVHGEAWKKRYPKVRAPNTTWWTISVGVPPEVLFPAIGNAFRVAFTACDPVDEAPPPVNGKRIASFDQLIADDPGPIW